MPTPKKGYFLADGKTKVPGTTTVISASLGWNKSALMYWAWEKGTEGKPFREETEKAAMAGTLAHAFVEAHIKAQPQPKIAPEYTDEMVRQALQAYENFVEWEETSQLVLYGSEIMLVSEQHRYGGTLDGVGEVRGKRALIDFKTSNGTYGDHIIQVAAYAKLWEEQHPDQPLDGGVHILRFGKEVATFAHHRFGRELILDKPWTAFLALRTLYDLKKGVEALAK